MTYDDVFESGPAAVVGALRGFPALGDASDDVLRAFADLVTYTRLPADCTVVEQGDSAESVYLLISGAVSVRIASADSREVVIGMRRAPANLGLQSVAGEHVQMASLVTATPVEVLELPRRSLIRAMALHPRYALGLLEELADVLFLTMSQLHAHTFETSTDRVIAALCGVGLAAPKIVVPNAASSSDWREVGPLTHSSIAMHAGVSRETVCRVLNDLVRSDAVVGLKGSSKVREYRVDLAALARCVGRDTTGGPAPPAESTAGG